MTKKKFLYLMHIPWGWIKQRPQFIAEELNKYYEVKVIVKKDYSFRKLKNETDIGIVELFRLPFERLRWISCLNTVLYRLQLRRHLNTVDIIWFTSPHFVNAIPLQLYSEKKVVYDCMDDILAFPNIQSQKKVFDNLYRLEFFLYNHSSIIFSSANFLKQTLISRYGSRNIVVVNNAMKSMVNGLDDSILPSTLNYFTKRTLFSLVYIGTISSWLDFTLLQRVVQHFSDIEIFLFGPTEVVIPKHDRIKYCGKVEHELVFKVMDTADALIMPFIVTDLIKSVNPVKLYEYIYSGKPCIAPLYGESYFFRDFVYLYDSIENCISILDEIKKGNLNRKSIENSRLFCKENTWEYRIKTITEVLKNL